MKKLHLALSVLVIQWSFSLQVSANQEKANVAAKPSQNIEIAFLADIHLHNIHADIAPFTHRERALFPTDKQGKAVLLRSMSSQLHSTRLFNENYYVLIAALDDIVARNIKLVALPGDFTDDGQPINVLAIKNILDKYTQEHGIQFFVITGNHDPVKPFTVPGGKKDFLLKNGQEAGVYSLEHKKCAAGSSMQAQTFCTNDIQHWGYKEIMEALAQHGFMPKQNYLHYETPFTQSMHESMHESMLDHAMQKRYLDWCSNDTPAQCFKMPDASYLVEPVEGLWLLAIDANVYVIENASEQAFKGSSSAGYNAMFTYKKPVLEWIKSVVVRAKQANKQLVAFSHFPMTDFYDGASTNIKQLFGTNAFQLKRLPTAQTENLLANTGLQLHFAGHMHINDTGTAQSDSGSTLFNIQVPSLAAYQPAYKILSLSNANIANIETVTVSNVPKFKTLFTHYQAEWEFNHAHNLPNWDKNILNVSSYAQFTDKHLQGVVTHRYIPKEWPQALVSFLKNNSLQALSKQAICAQAINIKISDLQQGNKENGLRLIYDFYRIKNADHIAAVNTAKKNAYLQLHEMYENCELPNTQVNTQLRQLLSSMAMMIQSEASGNFSIDLNTHSLQAR